MEDIDTGEDDLVETVIVQVSSLAVMDSYSTATSYSGTNGQGSISMQFRVTCAETYYGSDCSVKCVPIDGSDGHYTCNSDGTKSCLSGWSGSSTNCLTREILATLMWRPIVH